VCRISWIELTEPLNVDAHKIESRLLLANVGEEFQLR
jgi:hypothetical protein